MKFCLSLLPRESVTLPLLFWEICALTTFDILKFSMAVRLRGHKQRKLTDHVFSFPLFVSSKPHYEAEF